MSSAAEKLNELPPEERAHAENYIEFLHSKSFKTPNKETREALEDIRAGRNVTKHESAEDFYKAVGRE